MEADHCKTPGNKFSMWGTENYKFFLSASFSLYCLPLALLPLCPLPTQAVIHGAQRYSSCSLQGLRGTGSLSWMKEKRIMCACVYSVTMTLTSISLTVIESSGGSCGGGRAADWEKRGQQLSLSPKARSASLKWLINKSNNKILHWVFCSVLFSTASSSETSVTWNI